MENSNIKTTYWIQMNSDSLSVLKIIDKYFIKVSRNLGVFPLWGLVNSFWCFARMFYFHLQSPAVQDQWNWYYETR